MNPDSASKREWLRSLFGRRGAAFVLALIVELLIALLLLFMAPRLPGKKESPVPSVFGINVAGEKPSDKAEAAKESSERASREEARATPPPPPPPEIVPPPPPVPDSPAPMPFIRMTRRDYADADIAKAPSGAPPAAAESADAGESRGSAAGDSAPIGTAPNGEPLFKAEWYRRPTQAQLSPYLSRRATGPGWGLIACRTIARYQVTDCQELGEGPRGSGYAGSVRQAAFQFLVVPPRKGGKPLIGSWVAIRIDYLPETK